MTTIIDGTEQQVLISQNKSIEMSTYSGKKGKHTFSIMIAVTPDVHLCYISNSYVGSKTDLNIYMMPENQVHKFLEHDQWICFEKGYRGVAHQFKNVILPFLGKWHSLNSEKLKFNSEHSAMCAVVENFNKECKRFKICSNLFRVRTSNLEYARKIHNEVWTVVSGMVNEFVSSLRRD
jgi:hypothetical protein